MGETKRQGLLIVHTGAGKGKTTAAMGLAMRAWGDGLRVLILQFIKGGWTPGERHAIEVLARAEGRSELRARGLGFTRKGEKPREEHRRAAREALTMAERELTSGRWDMVILDEINYAVKFGLITEQALGALLERRPMNLHLVCTGRDACPLLLERADLITEMRGLRHPFESGIKAQKGIVISRHGFQQGAIQVAEHYHIGLIRINDDDSMLTIANRKFKSYKVIRLVSCIDY